MFYAILTASVIFTAKTSLDLFSLGRKHFWTLFNYLYIELPFVYYIIFFLSLFNIG